MTKRSMAAVVLVLLGVGSATMLYLFRGKSEESPLYGKINYRYRWGKPHEVQVDINRDGKIDYRAIVPGVFGAGVIPIETWQDPNFEGFFRYHVLFEGGEPSTVEVDNDGDGDYETRMQGEQARTFVADTLSLAKARDSESN